ncbi:hypothetical protein XaplCFBP3122_05170 [Xanthomonas arboricola pv. populi]|uniref:Uncharacterized protein n=2 Tax=Xanthomonas arboricola TaxID=56448 RepID=A0A2S6Z6Y5_9XANT|nr:hypothetical protein XaplCFBP3122_05170 [Xanthomonas arboricola pv. populi]
MATRNRQLQAMRGKNMHSVAIDCSDAQELAVTAGALPDDLIVLRYDKSASAAKQKGTGAVV